MKQMNYFSLFLIKTILFEIQLTIKNKFSLYQLLNIFLFSKLLKKRIIYQFFDKIHNHKVLVYYQLFPMLIYFQKITEDNCLSYKLVVGFMMKFKFILFLKVLRTNNQLNTVNLDYKNNNKNYKNNGPVYLKLAQLAKNFGNKAIACQLFVWSEKYKVFFCFNLNFF